MKKKFNTFIFVAIIAIFGACDKEDDTPTVIKSSVKELITFSFNGLTPAVVATISGTAISASILHNVDATTLVPTIVVSSKATVSPASGVAQNFSSPVTYIVTAEDGTTQNYIVTVAKSIAPKSSAKDILTVSFNATNPSVKATIDTTTRTITALLPIGTDNTKLVPTITFSDKSTVSPTSGIAQNLTNAVTYTVTAEDGSIKTYTMKAATDANYFTNIRMTVNEDNGYRSLNDSCLLNYRTGRVYLLKDGAANIGNTDLILNGYCGISLHTPIVLKNCGASCGVGRTNDLIADQKWTNYRVGDIDWITYNEVKVGGISYGQIASNDWDNLAFAADIDTRFSVGRKLDQKNDSNISATTLVNDISGSPCVPTLQFDKVLYRFISNEGKKGVLRITSFGKKSNGAFYVLLDIKIQK